jgi:geranylgeranyl diphosphate synthase type II
VTGASSSFTAFTAAMLPRVEATLERLLPDASEPPESLHRAMRHSMFPGGKRLRPMLALLACRIASGDPERALVPAAGLECLHTYSLIHDDLPCMDDDDLRRGRPTCHVVFGEALAILAGDALQALAFAAVAEAGGAAVQVLARAAGSLGMVGGQVGDVEAEGAPPTLDRAQWIHDRKTGALITASLEIGVLAGGGTPALREALREYGARIGRAFQIADDCLDETGAAAELGKRPGQDRSHGKLTYPAAIGLEASLAEARRLSAEAAALAPRIHAASAHRTGLDADMALLEDTALFLSARSR